MMQIREAMEAMVRENEYEMDENVYSRMRCCLENDNISNALNSIWEEESNNISDWEGYF